ncbi:MAG TPA: hypothetical protein VHB21_20365 [Minicystis sp.]|nr:hypothetical protein [Minicystis sp.]
MARSIDDYARVVAHVRWFGDQAGVLAALDVSDDAWARAAHWTEDIAGEALRGGSALRDRFVAAFSAAEAELRASAPESASGDVDRTLEAGDLVFRPALPFDPKATPSLASAAVPAPLRRAAKDPLDATQAMQPLSAAAKPLPFVTPRPLSVEQYASLCANLEAFPDKELLILERYGIDSAEELRAVHQAFAADFERDVSLAEAFDKRRADVRSRLGGGR